jgi:hypothetical protein
MKILNLKDEQILFLKYKKFTYREISQALGGKISEDMLKQHFCKEGRLYEPFLRYKKELDKMSYEVMTNTFRKTAPIAVMMMKDLLQKSLQEGKLRLTFNIINGILDRAGI